LICCVKLLSTDYAIEMFFVELVYDSNINQIVAVRSFISGHCLDKYSANIKTEY